ncbi:uncharacterized protein [Heterodontus francisci]|uniref:uncharacterized protein n=1 Tax=Heterodontus francisci TaxID=7792 RepID=UPI00355B1663
MSGNTSSHKGEWKSVSCVQISVWKNHTAEAKAIQPIEPGPAVRKSYPIQHQSDTSNGSQIQTGSSSLFNLLSARGCYYSVIPRSEGSEGNPVSSAVISALCFIFSRLILVHEQIQPPVCRMQLVKLFLIVCSLLPYVGAVLIQQIPPSVSHSPGSPVSIECICTEAAADSYFHWYRWHPDSEPQDLFYSNYIDMVTPSGEVDGFTARRPDSTHFYLESSGLWENHSAVYYCAWSLHSDSEKYSCSTKTPKETGINCGRVICLSVCL